MIVTQRSQAGIKDAKLGAALIGVRWALLAAYVPLALIGALAVGHVALAVSASMLAAYFGVLTVAEVSGHGNDPIVTKVSRYADVVGTTTVLVAMHTVTTPIWAVYFLTLVGIAHFVSKREMALYVVWAAANFFFAAVTSELMGYAVPWGYVGVIELIIAGMGANATVLAGGEQRLRDVLSIAARTDSLTGIANRRSLETAFAGSLQEALARRQPLAFMLIDVDHFKEINDRDGHPAGDDKLRDVAAALSAAARAGDVVARFGGDEFSVVAPHAALPDALRLAERLRGAAATCGASVSIGLAMFPEDARTQAALVDAADRALYAAKEAGRNCVRAAAWPRRSGIRPSPHDRAGTPNPVLPS
ncbi:MAG: GGDEF domain-containing protein [Dehalococcoidia bacterium]|nr:GGDEF domain-containing protein [Dehalococcoidia bacterium]